MYSPTGTPSYKAPEILLEIGYTHEVDMWAVGIICYQILSGNHPFKKKQEFSLEEINFNIKNTKYDFKDYVWND
ncbi:protein kinase domain protein, partial [Ichthyophthirius multifiliis]